MQDKTLTYTIWTLVILVSVTLSVWFYSHHYTKYTEISNEVYYEQTKFLDVTSQLQDSTKDSDIENILNDFKKLQRCTVNISRSYIGSSNCDLQLETIDNEINDLLK